MNVKNLVLPLATVALTTQAFVHHPTSFHSRDMSIRNILPKNLKSHDPEKSFKPSQMDKALLKFDLKELENKLRKKYEFTESKDILNEDEKLFGHPLNLDDNSDKVMKEALNILDTFKEDSATSYIETKIFLEKYLNSIYDNMPSNEKIEIKDAYANLLSRVNSYFDDLIINDAEYVDNLSKELKTALSIYEKMKSVVPLFEPPKEFLEDVQFKFGLMDLNHQSKICVAIVEYKEEMENLIKKAKEKTKDYDIKGIMQRPKKNNRNNNDWIL